MQGARTLRAVSDTQRVRRARLRSGWGAGRAASNRWGRAAVRMQGYIQIFFFFFLFAGLRVDREPSTFLHLPI